MARDLGCGARALVQRRTSARASLGSCCSVAGTGHAASQPSQGDCVRDRSADCPDGGVRLCKLGACECRWTRGSSRDAGTGDHLCGRLALDIDAASVRRRPLDGVSAGCDRGRPWSRGLIRVHGLLPADQARERFRALRRAWVGDNHSLLLLPRRSRRRVGRGAERGHLGCEERERRLAEAWLEDA